MPQVNMVHLNRVDPKDLTETKVLKEIRQGPPGTKGNQGPQGPKGDPDESISAPSFVSPPMSMVVNETGIASLQCEVKGNPTPQVTWLKQNSSLSFNKRILQSRDVRDVTSQDGGEYTCEARNILGVVTSSAKVNICLSLILRNHATKLKNDQLYFSVEKHLRDWTNTESIF